MWNFGFDQTFVDSLVTQARAVFDQFSLLVYLVAGIILAVILARRIIGMVMDWLDGEDGM